VRYFLEIAYNGAAYHGWQIQKNALSIQQVVNDALSTVLREKIEVTGSGRTDTGVHAEQQFVHLDTGQDLKNDKHLLPINAILPKDISVKRIYRVVPDAHARFSAIDRSYQYRIARSKNPFLIRTSYVYTKALNFDVMNEAAALLLTENMPEGMDFASFSRVKTGVSHFRCEVSESVWKKYHTNEFWEMWVFHITANRFLRGMVRSLVGTLLEVGKNRISIAEFQDIVYSRDRRKAGPAIEPSGLFLTRVRYPEAIFINPKNG
jgi:tRNA pseudouridine38-40 synthase